MSRRSWTATATDQPADRAHLRPDASSQAPDNRRLGPINTGGLSLRGFGPSWVATFAALFVVACGSPVPSPSSLQSAPPVTPPSTAPSASARPGSTEGPLPTVSIPTSQSFTAGLLYYCAFTPFPIELFEAPGIADENGDPATAFLRSGYMAADEWWLVDRTETRAEFVGHGSERDFYETAIVDRADDGRWESNNFGSCHPHSLLQGRGGVDRVTWWIREADWPRPSDRTLKIRARDLCPQGLADRVHATIRYGDDRIIMILATDPGIAGPIHATTPRPVTLKSRLYRWHLRKPSAIALSGISLTGQVAMPTSRANDYWCAAADAMANWDTMPVAA